MHAYLTIFSFPNDKRYCTKTLGSCSSSNTVDFALLPAYLHAYASASTSIYVLASTCTLSVRWCFVLMLHAHAHSKIDKMNGTHSGYFVCMYVSNRCTKFTTSWPTNLSCVGTVVFVHTHLICVSLYTHTPHM